MAKKMPGRLVALSASAVSAIYIAGLLSTQSVAATVNATAADAPALAATPAATATSTAAAATSTPSVVVGASASATPTAVVGGSATATPTSSGAAPSTSTTTSSSTYADGTYSATGTSTLGNVTVSVSVAADKITNVQITKVTTKFPVSRIASLPGQVIASQSANVNVVTGATYSSQAFRQAVQLALSQAAAARSTTAVAG